MALLYYLTYTILLFSCLISLPIFYYLVTSEAAFANLLSHLNTSLGQVLYSVQPLALNQAQSIIQRYLHSAIWTGGIVPLLLLPSFVYPLVGLFAIALLTYLRRVRYRRRLMFR